MTPCPRQRPITLVDLLTYRLGFGSVMTPPDTFPIQRAEAACSLQSIGGPPWPPIRHDVDSWIAALGSLPLMYQPGERWLYATSGQVLGVLLARAAGQPLEAVLRERIFEPLGMKDTGFTVPRGGVGPLRDRVPPGSRNRRALGARRSRRQLVEHTSVVPGRGRRVGLDDRRPLGVRRHGHRRRHRGGRRVLTPESVARMTTDHLTASQRVGTELFLEPNEGWGFGLAVPASGVTDTRLPCGIGWDGGIGTTWRSNPVSGVTGIALDAARGHVARTAPAPRRLLDPRQRRHRRQRPHLM